MTAAVGILNIILGIAYTTYGIITISEMKRSWKTLGFSHFGAAWIFMAFTCGPHHLVHGIHVLFEGRVGGPLDVLAVGIGLPAGVTFLALRFEATIGGRGDRFISGTPLWVQSLPTLAGIYLTVLVFGVMAAGMREGIPAKVTPNLALVVVYTMIGYFIFRTQLRNRDRVQGWSVSGLSLAVVFPTCALMHGVYALYASTGLYADADWHGVAIAWLAVPAGIYFLWVVRSLYRQSIRDWNRSMVDAAPNRPAVVAS